MTLSVEDRLALSDLVHRYAAYVDARDADAAVGLFTEDAVVVVPEPPRTLEPSVERNGHGGVRETLAALAHAACTRHEVTGESYAGDGDRAHGTVAGTAHHEVARGELSWRFRWEDGYRRTEEGWRIARRELTILGVEVRR